MTAINPGEQEEINRPAIDFSCRVCGVQCAIAPNPPDRAVCPDHCPDHDYKHDPWRRGKFCTICDVEIPEDYYWNDE